MDSFAFQWHITDTCDQRCEHCYIFAEDHLWTLFLHEKGLFTIPDNVARGIIYEGCNCGNNHVTILPNGDVHACRGCPAVVYGSTGNMYAPDPLCWKTNERERRETF